MFSNFRMSEDVIHTYLAPSHKQKTTVKLRTQIPSYTTSGWQIGTGDKDQILSDSLLTKMDYSPQIPFPLHHLRLHRHCCQYLHRHRHCWHHLNLHAPYLLLHHSSLPSSSASSSSHTTSPPTSSFHSPAPTSSSSSSPFSPFLPSQPCLHSPSTTSITHFITPNSTLN